MQNLVDLDYYNDIYLHSVANYKFQLNLEENLRKKIT